MYTEAWCFSKNPKLTAWDFLVYGHILYHPVKFSKYILTLRYYSDSGWNVCGSTFTFSLYLYQPNDTNSINLETTSTVWTFGLPKVLSSSTKVLLLKNHRITIKVDQKYRTAIDERAKAADLTISAYVRHCLDQYNQKSYKSPTDSEQSSNEVLRSELEIKNQQIDKLQQALDQEQQLHAASQKTIESKQLQIEDMSRNRSILARIREVFIPSNT